MPTLLLADDSELIRKAVKRILADEPTIILLGESENFGETITKTAELKPDILLLDLHMPDERQLEPEYIKTQLHNAGSQTKIIGMSLCGNDDEQARNLAASLGACTVLDKNHFPDELISAILAS